MGSKTIHIKEYESFFISDNPEKTISGYTGLDQKTFETLENFILTNCGKDTDAAELMGLSAKKGMGKIITAKNYVGIITLTNGTSIEILPKIYSASAGNNNEAKTKQVFIDMLKTLRTMPFKTLQTSFLAAENINIFEIFIKMFVDEVFFIVKRGLKCNYESIKENAAFFKGKMLFSKQIQFNHCHKERSYIEYDSFTANRPENKLLKATLLYLYKKTISSKNKNNLKILLNSFANIEVSANYKSDFAKCIPDQNMKDYRTALLWSRIFLADKSFTSFSGTNIALALLFPMEKLFESYIAALLKKQIDKSKFAISVQDTAYHLFDKPKKKFLLKPDIVVKRKSDGAYFILDTKWKILDAGKSNSNYGIAQADMYQMFAYQKKYNAENVILIYPKPENMQLNSNIEFHSDDGVIVHIQFIDLIDTAGSIENIVKKFEQYQ